MSRTFFFSHMGPWWDNIEARHSQMRDYTFMYYGGIFELRTHKLRLMSQLIQAVGPCRVKLAHLKNMEKSPERFVQDLSVQFGLEMDNKLNNLQPSKKEHKALCLLDEEWEEADRNIDWDTEAKFGSNRLDCHMCYQ